MISYFNFIFVDFYDRYLLSNLGVIVILVVMVVVVVIIFFYYGRDRSFLRRVVVVFFIVGEGYGYGLESELF